jgi:hypothetical protein
LAVSKKRRQDIGVFSLSMLDCICCGFGAIILLFVLTKVAEPVVIEQVKEDLSGVVKALEEQLHEIRGETAVLNRELRGRREQIAETKERIARLQGDLSDLQGEFMAAAENALIQNEVEGALAAALQELTEEMQRLLSTTTARRDSTVGGIPVDSEYIVFIIDTSGSMAYWWDDVKKLVRETLEVYPEVRGIQVMNDMGRYMFPQYKGRWMRDSKVRRDAIVARLPAWNVMSNSSPVEGIQAAIRAFHAEDKNISLYYFGDDFSGNRVQPVLDEVDRLNRAGADGRRRVRIHAVGFNWGHWLAASLGHLSGAVEPERFSILMRALCERNGGTFVGVTPPSKAVQQFRPCVELDPWELYLGAALPGETKSGRFRISLCAAADGPMTWVRAEPDEAYGRVRDFSPTRVRPGRTLTVNVDMTASEVVGEIRTMHVLIENDRGLAWKVPVHIVTRNPSPPAGQ